MNTRDEDKECKFFIVIPVTYHKKVISCVGLLDLIKFPHEGVRGVRQFFVDDERQRWWPLTWNEDIEIVNGDKFEIEFGSPVRKQDHDKTNSYV